MMGLVTWPASVSGGLGLAVDVWKWPALSIKRCPLGSVSGPTSPARRERREGSSPEISHSRKRTGGAHNPHHCSSSGPATPHQPLSIPARHTCTCSSHPFGESDLAKCIPNSISIFRHLLGNNQCWLRRFPVMKYRYSDLIENDQEKLETYYWEKNPQQNHQSKTTNQNLGAKFIPRLKEGESACVKPSATSTLLVPFRERK